MFGLFGIVLFVVLAVWGWSFLRKEKGLGFGENHESALDILKKRYAKGEISKSMKAIDNPGLREIAETISQKLKIIVETA